MILQAIGSGAWAALTHKGRATYAVISFFVHENGGKCSMRHLARYGGISKRAAMLAVNELITMGLIGCRKGNPHEPSQFWLLPPRVSRSLDERPPCVYCGKPSAVLDHVIPQSKGGFDSPENLVPCCHRCNTLKGALSYQEFLSTTERIMWKEREIEIGHSSPGIEGAGHPASNAKVSRVRLLSRPSQADTG